MTSYLYIVFKNFLNTVYVIIQDHNNIDVNCNYGMSIFFTKSCSDKKEHEYYFYKNFYIEVYKHLKNKIIKDDSP